MKDLNARKRARGIDRAFDILDHLRAVKHPQRPGEIAQALGAPKSTVYDLVATLVEHGMLETVDSQGNVFLGRRLYFLGLAYQEHFDLAREAGVLLKEITAQTSETSQFCMLDGEKYTVAMMCEGSRPFRISADVGERTPIPWTASGRLLLGGMADEEILTLIPPEDFTLPSGERMNRDAFLAEVRAASRQGFFSFDSIVDSFTHCFAAPVYDEAGKCVATLCIVAPKEDARANYDTYKQILIDAGRSLSDLLRG
ncbi:IclR family transcriptional regulator [Actibacterium sp. MT2.3-13A]|uniref:IclR family transcriptional regulator n=1 Tax=Actibacterium sp. MT2.3-13A TaxID=2828332 RepID=UPI001BAD42F0|nr:IclR family transcriptional regulator [Actibacterium sp. MT2.3-13A]